jgi:hypothetical protein
MCSAASLVSEEKSEDEDVSEQSRLHIVWLPAARGMTMPYKCLVAFVHVFISRRSYIQSRMEADQETLQRH